MNKTVCQMLYIREKIDERRMEESAQRVKRGEMKKGIHRKVLKSGLPYFMVRLWSRNMAVNQKWKFYKPWPCMVGLKI